MEAHDALGGIDALSSKQRYSIQLHWESHSSGICRCIQQAGSKERSVPVWIRHTYGRGNTGLTQFTTKERGIWGSITRSHGTWRVRGPYVTTVDISISAVATQATDGNWATRLGLHSNRHIQWQRNSYRLVLGQVWGEITPGNNYLALGYHQTREWITEGEINPDHVRRWNNISDMGTKPVEKQVIDRLLMYYVGYQSTLPEYGIHTATIQEAEAESCCRRCKPPHYGGTRSICGGSRITDIVTSARDGTNQHELLIVV